MILTFHPPQEILDTHNSAVVKQLSPTLKAIYPSSSTFGSPQTSVTRQTDNTIGISFGYSPYGSLEIGRTGSTSFTTSTSANFISSGLETSAAKMTLAEDPTTKTGVPAAFDFAVLIYLPAAVYSQVHEDFGLPEDKSFSCDLQVEAAAGTFPGRLWSPTDKTFTMAFDGRTELGRLELGGVVEVHRTMPSEGTDGSGTTLGLTIEEAAE